jgi:hypothetical protein
VERRRLKYGWRWIKRNGFVAVAYLLLGCSGILAFIAASTSLVQQGGPAIAMLWGVVSLSGSVLGLFGLVTSRVVVELIGAALGAAASLTWVAALLLQAVSTGSLIPLTAACMVTMLTVLLLQRWVDAGRPLD